MSLLDLFVSARMCVLGDGYTAEIICIARRGRISLGHLLKSGAWLFFFA